MSLYNKTLKRIRPYIRGEKKKGRAFKRLQRRYSRKINRVDARGAKPLGTEGYPFV